MITAWIASARPRPAGVERQTDQRPPWTASGTHSPNHTHMGQNSPESVSPQIIVTTNPMSAVIVTWIARAADRSSMGSPGMRIRDSADILGHLQAGAARRAPRGAHAALPEQRHDGRQGDAAHDRRVDQDAGRQRDRRASSSR